MYRRYYSYNDMPTISKPRPIEKKEEETPPLPQEKTESDKISEQRKFLGKLEADDLILLVVIFMLLADNCDDSLLLLALAFIFFNS